MIELRNPFKVSTCKRIKTRLKEIFEMNYDDRHTKYYSLEDHGKDGKFIRIFLSAKESIGYHFNEMDFRKITVYDKSKKLKSKWLVDQSIWKIRYVEDYINELFDKRGKFIKRK